MSFSAGYTACRAAIGAHVAAAWECTPYLGNMRMIPATASLPAAYVGKAADQPTEEVNLTPVTKVSGVAFVVGGIFAEPVAGTDLELFAIGKAELIRNLIDADHHLGGAANNCQVAGIDWALPGGDDPSDRRVYVTLTLECAFEYDR